MYKTNKSNIEKLIFKTTKWKSVSHKPFQTPLSLSHRHTHTSCPKLAVDTHKNTSPPSKLTPFSTKVTDLFQLLAQKNCTTWLKRHPQLTICTLPLAPPSSCKTVKPDTAGHSSQHKSHTSFYLGNPPFTCQVGLASDWPPRCQTQLFVNFI